VTPLVLTLLLLPQPEAATVRSISFTAVDEKGAPVNGLTRDEVAVLENGVARDLTLLEPDRRPLTLALLLDTSRPVASEFRLHVIPAVVTFVRNLPEGSRYAIWTTGDRPTKLVDYTTDVDQAERALRRAFLEGGNTLLDALIEAPNDMKKEEGGRNVVVAVTGIGIGFTNYDRRQVVDRASKTGVLFMGVLFEEGAGPDAPSGGDEVGRADYDFVLTGLADKTGGLRETTLSSMGIATSLGKIAEDLKNRYRLSYATLPEAKATKVEVKVARPGVKVRVSPVLR
jgi:VWFA-related protein